MTIHATLVASAVLLAGLGLAGGASARSGGHSSSGDSYLNDAQKNPRFIEPGGDYLASRNRISHPREGYYDRIRAQRGRYYGDVRVRPYRPYGGY